jgi:site-specific recombinase XerD
MIVTLTPAFIETQLILPPGLKKLEFRDATVRGLLIEVRSTPNSIPTWCLRQKVGGKNYFDYLGTIRELTVAQAKKIATQKKGERLASAKQTPEQRPTMGEMTLDTFWTEHAHPYLKLHKRSWDRDEQLYRIRIKPKFGEARLCDITRYQVQQFQTQLAAEDLSPASQDHHIKLFRRLLNLAVEWEFLEKNVLRGIKLLNVDNQLHDVADEEQLRKLVEVLHTDANRPVSNIILFLLSTGARVSEALKAKWSEVDLDKGIWYIPAANAKSKRGRAVPLNDSARLAIEEAGQRERFEVIFANPETGKHYVRITRTFYRLRKQAGIAKMRIHSCRHQYADRVLAAGGSLYSVQMLLGHADPRVSQRYAKLSMKALQEAANMAALSMPDATPPAAPKGQEAVAEVVEMAKVVQFPKAA